MTRRQRSREQVAALCDQIAKGKSPSGQQLRAINRRVDKRKGRSRRV